MMITADASKRMPLVLTALGVVFGDIGTSPLYAFKEAFAEGRLSPQPEAVLSVLSMIFWAVTLVVSLKYVSVLIRFDSRGEGGVLALMTRALVSARGRDRLSWLIGTLGVFAASLFYGDAIITPAISVLSAVEGIEVAAPAFSHWVVPAAVVILVGLFSLQRHGTDRVGRLFGPIMVMWFLTLAALGGASIAQTPGILVALNPAFALSFAVDHPAVAFSALSAVFLAVTGAEVMYADLGHFGQSPIRLGWFALVLPCLMLNYFGQGALVLRDPEAVRNPFFLLAPEPFLIPLVILATAATVIASQATISGAFSVTQQASRLNYLPRFRVQYTSETARGQIYIPVVNWLLLGAVLFLVLEFRSSSALAAAYGLAVSGDLMIGSLLLAAVLALGRYRWRRILLAAVGLFLSVEILFFAANLGKFTEGGWLPLLVAIVMFSVLSTWKLGTEVLRARKDASPAARWEGKEIDFAALTRVPGVAVFFSSGRTGCPTSFLHNIKHNHVIHETVLFLTIDFSEQPRVPDRERVEVARTPGGGPIRVLARFGFREAVDLRKVFSLVRQSGVAIDEDSVSFFASKPVLVSVSRRGWFSWRRSLFAWLLQNSTSTARYFDLPPNRVVEIGTQIAV
ncbi:MAG: potassium uptake protein [Pseudomonadota bacterium]|jgi:KUP system potassium uptake protein